MKRTELLEKASKHKYLLTIVIFGIFITFIDENSICKRIGFKYEIYQLEKEIKSYNEQYDESTQKLNKLSNDPNTIEKIAREKFLMKLPNEDIFLIED